MPGLIEESVVFGSKARGDAGPDSDVDVLFVLREGDRKTRMMPRNPIPAARAAMPKHRYVVLEGRASFGNVTGGLGGMRWMMIACDGPHSRTGWRLVAESVDPAEGEVVGAVEPDQDESLAGRAAAERESAAAVRTGHDTPGTRKCPPLRRIFPCAAAKAQREPGAAAGCT